MISIVTISFNQARFLRECIASVAGQTGTDFEYVVVDPGSTDGSRDIIAQHAESIDAAILEPDGGPADGLNKGFARTRGEILGYINADDRLADGALAYVAGQFAALPELDVLCGTIRIIDEQGRASLRARTADPFDLARYAAGICTVGQQATFFRRRAFETAGGFNADNRISWDGELLVDMALAGMRFGTTPKVLGDFRVYAEAMSARYRDRRNAEHERLVQKIRARGVPLYSSLQTAIKRRAYRFDPLRHLRYLVAQRLE